MRSGVLILILFILGCDIGQKENLESEKPLIVTTTGIIKNSIQEIIGEQVDVKSINITALLGPNSDPHLAKGSKNDLKLLFDADLIISNGLHLEGKLADVLHKFGKDKNHIKLSEAVPDSLLIKNENINDPHIWHNVKVWKMSLRYALQQIVDSKILDTTDFSEKKSNYLNRLDSLHRTTQDVFKQIPTNKRYLITSHDAFKYFGKAYGINVIGVQGVSTLSQTSIKRRAELTDFIIENKITYIFPETSTKDNYVHAIIEDCSAKGHVLKIGQKLYSDALGGKSSNADTYINMIEHNVNIITTALND